LLFIAKGKQRLKLAETAGIDRTSGCEFVEGRFVDLPHAQVFFWLVLLNQG
jgi:hypothetical protein